MYIHVHIVGKDQHMRETMLGFVCSEFELPLLILRCLSLSILLQIL